MGIKKSKACARASVYWPAMYSDIEREVKQCAVCNQHSNANQKEPLLPHPISGKKLEMTFYSRWKRLSVDCRLLLEVSRSDTNEKQDYSGNCSKAEDGFHTTWHTTNGDS